MKKIIITMIVFCSVIMAQNEPKQEKPLSNKAKLEQVEKIIKQLDNNIIELKKKLEEQKQLRIYYQGVYDVYKKEFGNKKELKKNETNK